jgi:translation elongation factor EF-1alpha
MRPHFYSNCGEFVSEINEVFPIEESTNLVEVIFVMFRSLRKKHNLKWLPLQTYEENNKFGKFIIRESGVTWAIGRIKEIKYKD